MDWARPYRSVAEVGLAPAPIVVLRTLVFISLCNSGVAISGRPLAGIRQRFSLILANLRYPTLKKIRFQIDQRAAAGCYLVLSGLRDEELDDLLATYANLHFEKVWTGGELGWSGVVLRKCEQ